jgi:hypothetical protein
LMMSRQLDYGDIVIISMRGKELFYEKIDSIDIYNYTESEWKQFKHEMINLEEPIHWEEALELPEQANDGLVARTETSM